MQFLSSQSEEISTFRRLSYVEEMQFIHRAANTDCEQKDIALQPCHFCPWVFEADTGIRHDVLSTRGKRGIRSQTMEISKRNVRRLYSSNSIPTSMLPPSGQGATGGRYLGSKNVSGPHPAVSGILSTEMLTGMSSQRIAIRSDLVGPPNAHLHQRRMYTKTTSKRC